MSGKYGSYARQFKGVSMPQEPINPLGPIYREAAPPSEVKKRQGLEVGRQTEANPGMVGKQDRMHKATGRRDY
jgi:hypothetical protein